MTASRSEKRGGLRPDPRALILGVGAWTALFVLMQTPCALAWAVGLALLLAKAVGAPWRSLLQRLATLNALLLFLLPLMAVESFAFAAWPWRLLPDRVALFASVALRANAILLLAQGLVSAMNMATLGHALVHLRCPPKLAQLIVFTARYMDWLREEWSALYRAARMRGFRMSCGPQTWRVLGALVGSLLLRSLDRAERVLQAMKCRGYQGRFFLLRHFRYSMADAFFAVALTLGGGLLFWIDRM
jgi:cobalt/nickel transport system permease protein